MAFAYLSAEASFEMILHSASAGAAKLRQSDAAQHSPFPRRAGVASQSAGQCAVASPSAGPTGGAAGSSGRGQAALTTM